MLDKEAATQEEKTPADCDKHKRYNKKRAHITVEELDKLQVSAGTPGGPADRLYRV